MEAIVFIILQIFFAASAVLKIGEYVTLNDWSRGEKWILFPKYFNVSRDEVKGNIETGGEQNSLFPMGPVIKWFVI